MRSARATRRSTCATSCDATPSELRRTRGLSFSVRMGLNSGEVVVGRIGDDLRMDYTAQGHTVGPRRSAWSSSPSPGTVYLSATRRVARRGYFALATSGSSTVKGVREPVRVFELAGLGACARVSTSRAHAASRVRRARRRDGGLEAALARALAGTGRSSGVVAEAGRRQEPALLRIRRALPRAGRRDLRGARRRAREDDPVAAVLELLRAYFGITRARRDAAAREKIAGTLLLLDEALRDALPLVFDFLGVADPDGRRRAWIPKRGSASSSRLVKRSPRPRSRREPAVLLLEDLHWVDGASEAVRRDAGRRRARDADAAVAELPPRVPRRLDAEVLLSAAPAAAARRGGERASCCAICSAPTPRSRASPIASASAPAGNPFFIEEIVQSLAETGSLEGTRGAYRLARPVETLALPPTVQAVLAARIDRLPEREKQVLQTAAVIGKEFAEPVSRAGRARSPRRSCPRRSARSCRRELVYETALYPQAEYTFKHPLTQEVAYGSQLGERRRQVHAAVARAIEATYPERLDEQAALLAHHWERADVRLSAADWHRRAAEWAGARDREVMDRHWGRVRGLLANVPASPETLALGLVACTRMLHNTVLLGHLSVDASVLFAEGMALAARLESPASRVLLLLEYGVARASAGAVDEGLAHLRKSIALADESGEPFLRFMARPAFASVLYLAGRLRESFAIATEAETLSGGDADLGADIAGFSPYCFVLAARGAASAWLGRPLDGVRVLEQAIETARQRRDAEATVNGHTLAAWAHEMLGDADSSLGTPGRRSRSPRRPGAGSSGRSRSKPSRGLTSSTGNAPRRKRPLTPPSPSCALGVYF